MKKFTVIALLAMITLNAFAFFAFAQTQSVSAYVTVSVAGDLKLAYEQVSVTDSDSDGAITMNDALYCAHEMKYDGGAEAGYAFSNGQYGLSLDRLWGDESGSFGYYLNNGMVSTSLAEPIKDGDLITAFVYLDTVAYSDILGYFNKSALSVASGESITLTLSGLGYDETYNPAVSPIADAVITVDGEATEYKTDAQGKVSFAITEGGEHIISAVASNAVIVPPVCRLNVSGGDTKPADTANNGGVSGISSVGGADSDGVTVKAEKGCGSVIAIPCMSAVVIAAAISLKARKKD